MSSPQDTRTLGVRWGSGCCGTWRSIITDWLSFPLLFCWGQKSGSCTWRIWGRPREWLPGLSFKKMNEWIEHWSWSLKTWVWILPCLDVESKTNLLVLCLCAIKGSPQMKPGGGTWQCDIAVYSVYSSGFGGSLDSFWNSWCLRY